MDASIKKELEDHDIYPHESKTAIFSVLSGMFIHWNDEVPLGAYRKEVEELKKLYDFLEKADSLQ